MNILICDDSGMARKQMARAIPPNFADHIHFAEHGEMALEVLAEQPIDLLFLDLTMPVMDGFETLDNIRERQYDCLVIVVSGDIQPEAKRRVMELGALAFLNKPVAPDTLLQLLNEYGLLTQNTGNEKTAIIEPLAAPSGSETAPPVNPDDCLKEISNIAMGQAADKLARLFNAFIHLPIPRIDTLNSGELLMTVESLADQQQASVCQGFIARGIIGEAILSIDANSIKNFESLVVNDHPIKHINEHGPILDAATLLTGAFMSGLGTLLDLDFSKSQPVFLLEDPSRGDQWRQRLSEMEDTLAIEIPYRFDKPEIVCDLLLLLPKASADIVRERASLLTEGDD